MIANGSAASKLWHSLHSTLLKPVINEEQLQDSQQGTSCCPGAVSEPTADPGHVNMQGHEVSEPSQLVQAALCSRCTLYHQQEPNRQKQQHAEELAAQQAAHDTALAAQQQAHHDELAAKSSLHDEARLCQDKTFTSRLEALKEEHSKLRAALRHELAAAASKEHDQLCERHDAARAEWEVMQKRRNADGKMFSYTVRGCEGPHLSGTVPRQIFEAEPDSALVQIYNGEWEYARDEQGRAMVNSNPEIWPIIIDWLSFGTVPENPSNQLIAECKYWQLCRFLAAIESSKSPEQVDKACSRASGAHVQAKEGSHHFIISKVCKDSQAGFQMTGYICNFGRLGNASDQTSTICIRFTAAARAWELVIEQHRCMIRIVEGATLVLSSCTIVFGASPQQMIQQYDGLAAEQKEDPSLVAGGDHVAVLYAEGTYKQISHPSLLEMEGAILADFTFLFWLA